MSGGDQDRDTYREFTEAVNMKPRELSTWLETDESKHVGWRRKGAKSGESVGHESGRKIIDLLRRKRGDLSEADYKHMRKVVGYVRRHMAQRPSGDVRDTRWRYSLMNWGHDPLKGPLPPPGGPSRKALERRGAPPKERRGPGR
ncbi:DUF3140 domain-containing protein [Micromonospora sp. NPDC047707]|uniref:DUF3140 domain-containing protein n=1 Tax=unclassified Micromonospora TaxID=2617518 RepID=UPI0012B48D8E|nr:DUF3140 domain-containing protein [Micromonospora sp. WMMC415]QGN47794.1 DUF3140 domain-containing protein [Micromonospora sp. WMMC415]